MQNELLNPLESKTAMRYVHLIVLLLIVIVGAYLRFSALGERSLWADEFATWHVSQLPLGESLRWQPEQNNTPLYQMFLRLLTDESRPSEWMLRLPAAIAGVLSIPAAYLLACMLACRKTALSLAALLAVNLLHIDYSQEARPYSLLVLGTILCTWSFLRLSRQPNWQHGLTYAVISALSFHAHYLTVFVLIAHLCWWVVIHLTMRKATKLSIFVYSWSLLVMLCAPMFIHCLRTRTATAQGLGWIDPITWSSTIHVLSSVTSGVLWVWFVLMPTFVVCAVWLICYLFKKSRQTNSCSYNEWLLVSWFMCSFFGLVVISLLVQPAMLVRYALPVTIPGLLGPLLLARRIHDNAPVYLALIFIVGSSPDWIAKSWYVEPGFRELTTFVQQQLDPKTDHLALVIDNSTFPGWEDVERLPLMYYPIEGYKIQEIHLDQTGHPLPVHLFSEQSHIYLILFRSDPSSIAREVQATMVPIVADGMSYSQLLFSPYRLARISYDQP